MTARVIPPPTGRSSGPARATLLASVLSDAAPHHTSAGAGVSTTTGEILAAPEGGVTVIRLCGDIDGALREQADAVLDWVLAEGAPVVVDGCGMRFVDSCGIAFLLRCARACEQAGLTLTVRNAPQQLTEVLDMLGLGRTFAACPD